MQHAPHDGDETESSSNPIHVVTPESTPRDPAPQPLRFETIKKKSELDKLKNFIRKNPTNTSLMLGLKKTTLRRFLRENGRGIRSRDKKDRLVSMVVELLKEREPPALVQAVVAPQRRKLKLGEHEQGRKCHCMVNFDTLLTGRPVQLRTKSVESLKKLVKGSLSLMNNAVAASGFVPDLCTLTNAYAMRDVLEKLQEKQDRMKEEEALKEELAHSSNLNTGFCAVCSMHKARVIFKPCLHLTSCGICATKLQTCPICRGQIYHIQFLNNSSNFRSAPS